MKNIFGDNRNKIFANGQNHLKITQKNDTPQENRFVYCNKNCEEHSILIENINKDAKNPLVDKQIKVKYCPNRYPLNEQYVFPGNPEPFFDEEPHYKLFNLPFYQVHLKYNKEAQLIQSHYRQIIQALEQKTDLEEPKPPNNYCSVCVCSYDDYLEHCDSEMHQKQYTNSEFYPLIKEECQNIFNKRRQQIPEKECIVLKNDYIFTNEKYTIKQSETDKLFDNYKNSLDATDKNTAINNNLQKQDTNQNSENNKSTIDIFKQPNKDKQEIQRVNVSEFQLHDKEVNFSQNIDNQKWFLYDTDEIVQELMNGDTKHKNQESYRQNNVKRKTKRTMQEFYQMHNDIKNIRTNENSRNK